MNIKFLKYLLPILLLIQGTAIAQSHTDSDLKEKISVLTDRSLYATGEIIHFTARQVSTETIGEEGLSQVLYVDLIAPDGQIMHSSKFPLRNNNAEGAFRIPEDALSGTYYLNAYTKWLRNYDLSATAYLSVRIINPFLPYHLQADTLTGRHNIQEVAEKEEAFENIQISTTKHSYDTRQKVSASIKNSSANTPARNLIVSVVPAGSLQNQVISKVKKSTGFPSDLLFIPETRGITISGTVRNTQDNAAAIFSPVFLTLLDSERSFYPTVSDSLGNFYFHLPEYKSENELFISVNNFGDKELNVLIDSDFATNRLALPSFSLEFDSLNYYTALQIVRNQQLRSQYYPDEKERQPAREFDMLFYGKPSKSIKFSEFVDLPSLEDYFLELLPMVNIIRTKGIPDFRINGPQAEMKIYDPLVIIDGVAVHDNNAVLAIDPQKISQLEIVDRPWIRGNMIFGGIISIISRNNDFAGVKLPDSGLFLTYRFYEQPHPAPQYYTPDKPNMPDIRNTLFWNPKWALSAGETKELNFTTPDIPGDYLIVIREISSEGKIKRMDWRFSVE
jgi:hypothetical protein